MLASRTPVTTHLDQQHGRPPTQRFMRQAAGHHVPRQPLSPTLVAEPVIVDQAAPDLSSASSDTLTDSHQTKLVKTAKSSQVRISKGTVKQVEAFRTDVLNNIHP